MIKIVKQGSAYNIQAIELVMDSSNELASLPTNLPQGSIAYAIDDQSRYMLNSAGEWKPQLDTGKDRLLLDLAREYTDNSILGVDGALVGDSAYESAVKNGYAGTIVEWLLDIQGKPPKINEVTRTWELYDPILEEYVDTGLKAVAKDGLDGLDGMQDLENDYTLAVIDMLAYYPIRLVDDAWSIEYDREPLDEIEFLDRSDPLDYLKAVADLLIDFIESNTEQLEEEFGSPVDLGELERIEGLLEALKEAEEEEVEIEMSEWIRVLTYLVELVSEDYYYLNPYPQMFDQNLGAWLAELIYEKLGNTPN